MKKIENNNFLIEIDGIFIDLEQDNYAECCTISPEDYIRYYPPFNIQGIDTLSSTDK
jgi:hypothetical protein